MNVYDGEQIGRGLAALGYRPVDDPKSADVIVVMDGGQILAQGQHDDLMRTCPIYQGL